MDDDRPRWRPTSDQVVTIETGSSDRSILVRIGEFDVARTNYDEVGWAGIDAVERTARRLAEALGCVVESVES